MVIDQINAAQDRVIASKLRRDSGVLVLARSKDPATGKSVLYVR